MKPIIITADEAAKMLGVSTRRVYALVRKKIIPAVRLGRQVKFDPAALAAFVAKGGKK